MVQRGILGTIVNCSMYVLCRPRIGEVRLTSDVNGEYIIGSTFAKISSARDFFMAAYPQQHREEC